MRKKIKNGLIMLLVWAALSILIFLLWRRDVQSKADWKDPDRISVIRQNETVGRNANIYILHDKNTGIDVLYIDNWFYSDSSAVRLTEKE